MTNNQKGFGVLEAIAVLVIIGLIGFGGWYIMQTRNETDNASNTTSQDSQKKNGKNSDSTKDAYEGMTKYANTKYGLSFYHVADWKTEEVVVENPSGLTPTEFAVNVKAITNEKYAETATLEIHTKNLQEIAKTYEKDMYGQSTTAKVDKVTGTLKGKEAVHFTITNPNGDKTEHYLFAAGDKTYSFKSINEELNVQRSQEYWNNFQKLYDSLQLK